jgi:hypothetical protein
MVGLTEPTPPPAPVIRMGWVFAVGIVTPSWNALSLTRQKQEAAAGPHFNEVSRIQGPACAAAHHLSIVFCTQSADRFRPIRAKGSDWWQSS